MTYAEDLTQVAVQVAHDLRSPLAALTVIEQDLSALPDDTRALLKAAITRLKEVTSDLLDRTRGTYGRRSPHARTQTRPSVQEVGPLLEALLAEKRLQHRPVADLEIAIEMEAPALNVLVAPAEFQRVISNLIDNGVEACEGRGKVTVSVSAPGGTVQIRVADDGKGMSAEVLRNAGREGYTHGKKGGSGLGLAHARRTLEAWGGALTLRSTWGYGTVVTLELPRV